VYTLRDGAQVLLVGAVLLPRIGCAAAFSSAPAPSAAIAPSQVQTLQLRRNFYLIAGAGENIGLQTGDDGTVLVDAGAVNASDQVLAAVSKVTQAPIRYIIDTSADAAAVGGNAALAKAGQSIYAMGTEYVGPRQLGATGRWATILAGGNVLTRMAAATGKTAPYPSADWPTNAFVGLPQYYIYFNHEAAELYPVAAHDDTDTIVFFRASDVILAGDIINADQFPTIDLAHGGSIRGEIAALNEILRLSDSSMPFASRDEGTDIIPSYGHVYLLADVARYRDMVVQIRDVIASMIQRRMTLEQIEAASPCLSYENEYGRSSGPWTTTDFVQAVYASLMKEQHPAR